MKFCWLAMVCCLLLTGCGGEDPVEQGLSFRDRLLNGQGCSFQAELTADYGDTLRVFTLDCRGDAQGKLEFSVLSPETIQGITGSISAGEGCLIFDGTALAFPLLADGELAPVSAPWLFLKTLRSGCITAAGWEGERLRLTIDDSFEADALTFEIWFSPEAVPVQAEIVSEGRKVLSMNIGSFQIS